MSSERWSDLPNEVRQAVERHTGHITLVDHHTAGLHSEFSATVHTTTGRVFVKGNRLSSPHLWMQHHEARVNRFLPTLAPRLLWTADTAGWLVHGYEHVTGRRATLTPGTPDLQLVADSLTEIHRTLTPCPDEDARDLADQWDRLSAWRRLRDDPPTDLDSWTRDQIDRCVDLEPQAVTVVQGDSLAHTDLHPLNILIDHTAHVIDWAWSRRATAWVDTAFLVIRLIDAGHSPRDAEDWASTVPGWQDTPAVALSLFAIEVLGIWEHLQHHRPLSHRGRLTDAARIWARHRSAMVLG